MSPVSCCTTDSNGECTINAVVDGLFAGGATEVLIADEPTGNLDPDLSLEVMRIFRRFNEVGVTLLIASHDLALIDQLGCRRIPLENGALRVEEERDEVADYFEDDDAPPGDDRWV